MLKDDTTNKKSNGKTDRQNASTFNFAQPHPSPPTNRVRAGHGDVLRGLEDVRGHARELGLVADLDRHAVDGRRVGLLLLDASLTLYGVPVVHVIASIFTTAVDHQTRVLFKDDGPIKQGQDFLGRNHRNIESLLIPPFNMRPLTQL